MNTTAEALALFEQKKAAIGIKDDIQEKTSSKTVQNRFSGLKSSSKSAGRRPRDSRTPGKSVCYLTLFLIGSSIGIASGVITFATAFSVFGAKNPLLSDLWWISLVSALVFIVGAKAQMDAIRETVFTKKKDGKVVHLRVRRRHEVVVTLLKRVAIALILATILGAGLNYAIINYKSAVITGVSPPATDTKAIPPIGTDVFFVIFAITATLSALGVTELALRLTQKEGITYQAATIFLSSTTFLIATLIATGKLI